MAKYKARPRPKLPPSFYKPIGQLIAGYTFTELYMQSIAWHLLKVRQPKAARLLTWGRNSVDLCKLFFSLAPRWIPDPADQKEHKELYDKIDRIRADRNKLAHGVWAHKMGQPKVMRLFYLRENVDKIEPKGMTLTATDLEQWAANLDALNERLKAFHKKLGAPTP